MCPRKTGAKLLLFSDMRKEKMKKVQKGGVFGGKGAQECKEK